MSTHCPVCGKEYGLFEKLTQPTMCRDCFKSGGGVASSALASASSQSLTSSTPVNTSREQSPSAFLEAVRSRTCYSALRGMIAIFAVLSIIGILVLAGFYVVVGVRSESALPVILGVVVGLLGCFLVIASKQASLLLIDIADTLIEQNRKKGKDTE